MEQKLANQKQFSFVPHTLLLVHRRVVLKIFFHRLVARCFVLMKDDFFLLYVLPFFCDFVLQTSGSVGAWCGFIMRMTVVVFQIVGNEEVEKIRLRRDVKREMAFG